MLSLWEKLNVICSVDLLADYSDLISNRELEWDYTHVTYTYTNIYFFCNCTCSRVIYIKREKNSILLLLLCYKYLQIVEELEVAGGLRGLLDSLTEGHRTSPTLSPVSAAHSIEGS